MATKKFTEAECEKLFAQLEAPFDPALIKWRVMRTFDHGRSGVILPFADPRAYTDRLNSLTPSGWDTQVHDHDRAAALPPIALRYGPGQDDCDPQGAGSWESTLRHYDKYEKSSFVQPGFSRGFRQFAVRGRQA